MRFKKISLRREADKDRWGVYDEDKAKVVMHTEHEWMAEKYAELKNEELKRKAAA